MTFQYLEVAKPKCDAVDIYLWSSLAAKNINDMKLASRFLSLALNCNPRRLLLWKELFAVGKDLPNFDKVNFLKNANLNLNNKDYYELWEEVNHQQVNDSKLKYSYSLTPAFSSNYNNGLLYEEIELFGLPFKTSEASRKKTGFGLDFILFGNLELLEKPLSSIDLNLGISASDFPSYSGDRVLLNGELNYLDYSGQDLNTFSFSFKRLEFAKNSIFNSRKFSLQKNYRYGKISSYKLNLYEKNFYDSEFRSGYGIDFELKYLTDNFSLSPRIESFNADSESHSFRGLGVVLGLKQLPQFRMLSSKNIYEEELAVFGKKRVDTLIGFNYKFREIQFLDASFIPSLNFIKINSNINIYRSNSFELNLNYLNK